MRTRSEHRRLTRLLLVISIILTTPSGATALFGRGRFLSNGVPGEVGMSAAILKAGTGLYRAAVERGDLVGAVLLVARDGKVVLHEALGWRDIEHGLPMEQDTMFRMASNTKPVVATAISILVEEETLRWTDPVRRHIPSFDNYRSGFINIHQLLSHTSGLRINTLFVRPLMTPSPEHPDAPTLRVEAARFGEVGAEALPGATYAYSNPGYNTLGALVEIATDQMLEDFLRERIYRPLGMFDSYHHEMAEKLDGKLDRMSAVYYERKNGRWIPGWSPGDAPQIPFVRASGGMISTAADYAIFCQMFLNGGAYGGAQILTSETVKLMTTPQSPGPIRHQNDGDAVYYGYGWSVTESGVYSHGGSDGTFAWIDPERRLFGLIFTQNPRGVSPRQRFIELVNLSIGEN